MLKLLSRPRSSLNKSHAVAAQHPAGQIPYSLSPSPAGEGETLIFPIRSGQTPGGASPKHPNYSVFYRYAPLASLCLFALFLLACSLGLPRAGPVQVAQGRSLYIQACQECHGDAATGDGAVTGTPVHSVAGHTWHHADGQLADIILGRLVYPERKMPSYARQLSEKDVQAILAYLKSNWPLEQRAYQAEASKNWKELQKTG